MINRHQTSCQFSTWILYYSDLETLICSRLQVFQRNFIIDQGSILNVKSGQLCLCKREKDIRNWKRLADFINQGNYYKWLLNTNCNLECVFKLGTCAQSQSQYIRKVRAANIINKWRSFLYLKVYYNQGTQATNWGGFSNLYH